jgi:PAS domain S-box-containing protein
MTHTLSDDTAAQAQRLSDALDCVSEAFFSLDREWRFTHVNARAQALFGCPSEALLGESLMKKIPDMGEGAFFDEFTRAMTGGEVRSFDAYYPPLGAPQKVRVFPTQQGLAVFFRDVTEARVPEQRLLEEQETLLAVVKSTDDAIISTDLGGRIKMFNPGAERIFRRSQASVLNQGMEILMPERFRAAHAQHQHQFAQSGEPSRMMGLGLVKGLRSDGQEIELEGAITHVTVAQRQILIANLRDVTERMRGAAEMELSRQQLSELTQRLMQQEKTLVKRLAQVLHDQLGQTIAAIRVAHETILTLQGAEVLASVERLQAQLGTLIAQAVRQVRQVLIDLRPPLLEEQGLSAALDNELRNRSLTHPQTDIAIHVDPPLAQMRWPAEVEYAGFMVVREAVENALRHADASSVSVRLQGSASSLTLEVADDGSGLVPAAMLRAGHLGMRDMRERASGVGASLVVDSGGSTVGTRVTFSWELEA